jgi:ABC-type maltose transport system permease subunit
MNLGLNTFLLRSFYASIPQELDAAAVDSAPVAHVRSVADAVPARPATVAIFGWLLAGRVHLGVRSQ